MTTRQKLEFWLTFAAMCLILAYNFKHTADLLAGWVLPAALGYCAALGIELTIVRLSFSIGGSRAGNGRKFFYYFVLGFALVISIVANIAEGFHVKVGQELTTETWGNLDPIQLALAVGANLLLSATVASLAEIMGSESSEEVMPRLPARLRNMIKPGPEPAPGPEQPKPDVKSPSNNVNGRYNGSLKPQPGESRLDNIRRFVKSEAGETNQADSIRILCKWHGVTHTTIRRDFSQLEKEGFMTLEKIGSDIHFKLIEPEATA